MAYLKSEKQMAFKGNPQARTMAILNKFPKLKAVADWSACNDLGKNLFKIAQKLETPEPLGETGIRRYEITRTTLIQKPKLGE